MYSKATMLEKLNRGYVIAVRKIDEPYREAKRALERKYEMNVKLIPPCAEQRRLEHWAMRDRGHAILDKLTIVRDRKLSELARKKADRELRINLIFQNRGK